MSNEQQLLVDLETYLKSGIHIGTKFKTKYMEKFIFKSRPEGLYILNLEKIDERLKILIKFLSRYNPEDILVVGRRENAFKPLKMLSKYTGIRVFPGRYPPGLLTNLSLENFTEIKVMFVVDPWPDRNAVLDAYRMGIPIVALCDTNNQPNMIDLVIPANNKGKKSLALIFMILTKEYLKNRGQLTKEVESLKLEDFMEE